MKNTKNVTHGFSGCVFVVPTQEHLRDNVHTKVHQPESRNRNSEKKSIVKHAPQRV